MRHGDAMWGPRSTGGRGATENTDIAVKVPFADNQGGRMAYGIVLAFEGVGADQYWGVNEKLGINPDGTGDWPNGLRSHAGGPTAAGWVVCEVWDSKADQEAFMASRLGAALGEVGVPAPSQIIESDLVNYQTP
jgi:hypothetical protein